MKINRKILLFSVTVLSAICFILGTVFLPKPTKYVAQADYVAPHAATATCQGFAAGWNNSVSGTISQNLLSYDVKPLGDAADTTNLAATANPTSLMVKYNGTTFADLYGTNHAYTISYANGSRYFVFKIPTADLFDGAVFEIEEGTPFMNHYLNGVKYEYDTILNAWEPYVELIYGTPTFSAATAASLDWAWNHKTDNLAANKSEAYGYTGISGWAVGAAHSTNLAATKSVLSLSVKLNGVSFYDLYKTDDGYRISAIIQLFGFSVPTAALTTAAANAAGYDYPTIEVVEGTPFYDNYLPALKIVFIDGAWELAKNYNPTFTTIRAGYNNYTNGSDGWLFATFNTTELGNQVSIPAADYTGINYNGQHASNFLTQLNNFSNSDLWFIYQKQSANDKLVAGYNGYSHPTIEIEEGATVVYGGHTLTFHAVTFYFNFTTDQWQTTMPDGYFAGLPTYEDDKLAVYDIVSVKDVFGVDEKTIPAKVDDTYPSGSGVYSKSIENTTSSVVFRFELTVNSAVNCNRLITLRVNGSKGYRFMLSQNGTALAIAYFTGSEFVNLSDNIVYNESGTVPATFDVELGAIDLLDGTGVWQYAKVDGVYLASVVHATAEVDSADTNIVKVFSTDEADWTMTDNIERPEPEMLVYEDDELAVYDIVSVKDVFGVGTKHVSEHIEGLYTLSETNTTGSVAFRFKLTVNSSSACERLIILRANGSRGYRFLFGIGNNGTQVLIGYFSGSYPLVNQPDPVIYNKNGTVPATFDVEIGAINLLDGSGVWQYVKVDDTYLISIFYNANEVDSACSNLVIASGTDSEIWTLRPMENDGIAPVITYTGSDPFIVRQGARFVLPATAYDEQEDTEIELELDWGNVELGENGAPIEMGVYTLTISATDYFGNVATKTIDVEVIEPDTEAPVINLGFSAIKAKVGAVILIEPTATDNSGFVTVNSVWSDGATDVLGGLTVGEHTWTIMATDLSDNVAIKVITVYVTEDVPSFEFVTNEENLLIEYIVKFDGKNAVMVYDGEKLERPEDPTKAEDERARYTFIGWFNGEEEWDFDNDVVTQDINLVSRWAESLKSYLVTFEGGSSFKVSYGDKVLQSNIPANPTKSSTAEYEYSFEGWYVGDKLWNFETDVITGTTVFTPKFTETKRQYRITFEGADTRTYLYGDKIEKPADPTKEATDKYIYTFLGWEVNGKLWNFETDKVNGNLNFRAKWQETEIGGGDEPLEPISGDSCSKGCSGSVSGSLFAVLVIAGAFFFIKKKKEN